LAACIALLLSNQSKLSIKVYADDCTACADSFGEPRRSRATYVA
jgi:hypothetical protein